MINHRIMQFSQSFSSWWKHYNKLTRIQHILNSHIQERLALLKKATESNHNGKLLAVVIASRQGWLYCPPAPSRVSGYADLYFFVHF